MRGVPWWGVVSAVAAPVLLVVGWTVAAGLQARGYDPVSTTVSALAARGATDRWVMTLVFVVVGVCEVMTSLALHQAATAGRLVLIAGGIAGVLVAANPEPAGGASLPHSIWASLGLAALVLWPLGAWRTGPGVPWGLRRAASAVVTVVLFGLLVWFTVELVIHGAEIGLAERVLGAAQALWPLLVVLSCSKVLDPDRMLSEYAVGAHRHE
ncbi:MAG TPA: DUF998 domain-containing protein [Streptosporangiaceae bacterium]|nr:DUF998 domain-containing protein [Streptosporangiaceae bacterium]